MNKEEKISGLIETLTTPEIFRRVIIMLEIIIKTMDNKVILLPEIKKHQKIMKIRQI